MEFSELTDFLKTVKSPWAFGELSASIKMDKSTIDKLLGKDTDGDIMEKSYMTYEYDRHVDKENRWISNHVVDGSLRKPLLDQYKKGLIEGREIVWKSVSINRIIFNDPATIVFWNDGTKTVVKCQKGQTFNPYFGLCAAMAKKLYGSNSMLNRIVGTYYKEEDPKKDKCAWCKYASTECTEEPCSKCKNGISNSSKSYWEGVK